MKTEYEKVLLPKSVQQELEKLRTQAVADASEIARLQSGFDELKEKSRVALEMPIYDDFDRGFNSASKYFANQINRITGVEK